MPWTKLSLLLGSRGIPWVCALSSAHQALRPLAFAKPTARQAVLVLVLPPSPISQLWSEADFERVFSIERGATADRLSSNPASAECWRCWLFLGLHPATTGLSWVAAALLIPKLHRLRFPTTC